VGQEDRRPILAGQEGQVVRFHRLRDRQAGRQAGRQSDGATERSSWLVRAVELLLMRQRKRRIFTGFPEEARSRAAARSVTEVLAPCNVQHT